MSKPTKETKPFYVSHNGMDTIRLNNDVDSVGLIFPDGREIELQYRKSDGEVSLNTNGGVMRIEPRATNVIRLTVTK